MAQTSKRVIFNCGQQIVEQFKSFRVNNQFKVLPFEQFYVTSAKKSGPIALLYNKYQQKQYKLPEKYDNHILIFNCKGQINKYIPFDLKERIILFQFTSDEYLIILYATAYYYIYDSITGLLIKQGNYLSQEDFSNEDNKNASNISSNIYSQGRCVGAELVGEVLIIIRQKTLGIVENIMGGQWKVLSAIKLHPELRIFHSHYNANNQLEITFLNRDNGIECFNFKKFSNQNSNYCSLVIQNKFLSQKSSGVLISLSKKQDYISLIFQSAAVVVKINMNINIQPFLLKYCNFKIQKDDPLVKSRSKYRYRNMYQIGWLDNLSIFSDKKRLIIFNDKSQLEIINLNSSCNYIAFQSNCFRLIEEFNFIYRTVTDIIYLEIIDQHKLATQVIDSKKILGKNKQTYMNYLQLHQNYNSFINKQVIDIKKFNVPISDVEEICDLLLQKVELCLDVGEQLRVLRFANFLKQYYQCQASLMRQKCADLRVINNLKHQKMNRFLLYCQYNELKNEQSTQFLSILLRYNMHYIADIIFEDSQSKQKILSHWAKCKISKESQLTAIEQIKNKYLQMEKNITSTRLFTDLAKYCLEKEKLTLASKLIQLEQHTGRKIMVALLILTAKKDPQFVDKLLDFTQISTHSQIIYIVLKSLRKSSNDWLPLSWLNLLPKRPNIESHYLRQLRKSNDQESLQQYLTANKLYIDLGYISLRQQLIAESNVTIDSVKDIVAKDYSKLLPTLSQKLKKCEIRPNIAKLRELKTKKYPITEDDCSEFRLDNDFEYLAELIIQRDKNLPLGIKILKQMKSDKVFKLLMRKGKSKDAMDLAFQRRNKEMLNEIISKQTDELEQYGKQLYGLLLANPK